MERYKFNPAEMNFIIINMRHVAAHFNHRKTANDDSSKDFKPRFFFFLQKTGIGKEPACFQLFNYFYNRINIY